MERYCTVSQHYYTIIHDSGDVCKGQLRNCRNILLICCVWMIRMRIRASYLGEFEPDAEFESGNATGQIFVQVKKATGNEEISRDYRAKNYTYKSSKDNNR